ncbi:MAG: glycoside hydrolase family 2 TIM barrel-domain containing protein [Gammaproteobacteria bacterium]
MRTHAASALWSVTRRAAVLFTLGATAVTAVADPIEVRLREDDGRWQLLRGGEPYFIHGAGGKGSLKALAAAGANSVRTWGADDLDALLDEAHALGLTVTVGIWLGHERHGFDYDNKQQVAEQLAQARQAVLRYKDHPALLLWGVGNEAEGFATGDNPAIWRAINDVAAMVKTVDPLHPTMTVTAEIGGERVRFLHEECPAIDIHGINSYGGASSLLSRYRAAGATKPFVLTEFGPRGTWESATTSWGAPFEPTSTEKAAAYKKHYAATVAAAPDLALGAYAFLWGTKMEGTATWFGMQLADGTPLAATDTMQEIWGGTSPTSRAPVIEPLQVDGDTTLDPGKTLRINTRMHNADHRPITTHWALYPEANDYVTGGDFRPTPPVVEDAIIKSDTTGALLRLPDEPGAYRLFVEARDDSGKAATANVPLLVRGEPRTRLPVYVYRDGFEGIPWAPSGWMGDHDALSLDGEDQSNPHEGDSSVRISLAANALWAGIAWQNPPNNWGDRDGGFNLKGARTLEFFARGRFGGEQVKFGVGIIGKEKKHPDSLIVQSDDVTLTSQWQRIRIPLKGKDLSSVKTGFVVTLYGKPSPVTVYLDSIRFIR